MLERKPYRAFLQKPESGSGMFVKVYLVFQSTQVTQHGKKPEDFLIDMKIRKAAAERVRDLNPGSYIVRGFATKN